MSFESDCEICHNSSQISWRLKVVEKKVDKLERTLYTIMASSIGTLIGVIMLIAQQAIAKIF